MNTSQWKYDIMFSKAGVRNEKNKFERSIRGNRRYTEK